MTTKTTPSDIIIYQAPNGAIEFRSDTDKETIRANQRQIADIFDVDIRTINEHINTIFESEELEKESTIRKFQIVQQEGTRKVKREILHYNLDMIISIGYRVNSKVATKFRQRATTTLRQHITQWFTINPNRIQLNYQKFLQAVDDVKALASYSDLSLYHPQG